MTIQEAAEKYYPTNLTAQKMYVNDVTHYLDLLKAEGYEMVKVEGEALAIGRQQGRKEANADTINSLNKLAGVTPPKTEQP